MSMHNFILPNVFFPDKIKNPFVPHVAIKQLVDKQDQTRRRQNIAQLIQSITSQNADLWIFCIKNPQLRQDQYLRRVANLYKLIKKPEQVPQDEENENGSAINHDFILEKAQQIENFMKLEGCNFKIVMDVNSSQEIIRAYKDEPRVTEFFIYRNDKDSQRKTHQLKSMSKKVKQIFNCLNDILDIAGQQMQEEHLKSKIKKNSKKVFKTLPNFITLNKKMSHLTVQNYINAVAAIKMNESQKLIAWSNFKQAANAFIQKNFEKQQQVEELKQLKQFVSLIENTITTDLAKKKGILEMYTQENFFHKMLNNFQRTIKGLKEFQICNYMFHEVFKSIQLFYNSPQQNAIFKEIGPEQIFVYRGCKMTDRQIKMLQQSINSYIMLLGFASFSTSKKVAKEFASRHSKGYIIRMKILKGQLSQLQKLVDFGYLSLNISKFVDQLQVLFNALNVYKVTKITQQQVENETFKVIDIQYGAIFELLKAYAKDPQSVQTKDLQAIINYNHCISMLQKIRDKSDALLQSGMFKEAQQYKQNKKRNQPNNFQVRIDLANIYRNQSKNYHESMQCLKQAQLILQQQIKENKVEHDESILLNYFQLQKQKIQLSQSMGNYSQQHKQNQYLKIITQNHNKNKAQKKVSNKILIQQAKVDCKRGNVDIKVGKSQKAHQKLDKATENIQKILNSILETRQKAKNSVIHQQSDAFTSLRNFFGGCIGRPKIPKSKVGMQQQEPKLNQQKPEQHQFRHQLSGLCVDILLAQKQISQYQQNAGKIQEKTKNGKNLVNKIKQTLVNDSQVEKYIKVSQAIVQSCENFDKSRLLLSQALQIDKKNNQCGNLNEDSVKILVIRAKINKEELDRSNNWNQANSSKQKLAQKYSKIRQEQIYQQASDSLSVAISILGQKKSQVSIQVQNLRKMQVQLHFGQNKIPECVNYIRQMKAIRQWQNHIGMATIHFTYAKIHFDRGDLARARKSLRKASELMGSNQQDKFTKGVNFENLQFEIYLLTSRLFKREMNQDKTRFYLELAEKVLKKQNLSANSHSNYAILYQQYATLETMKQIRRYDKSFYQNFSTSISILEQMRCKDNIPLAACYLKYAGLLLLTNDNNDLKKADDSLMKAFKILQRFPKIEELPRIWLLYYIKAKYLQRKRAEGSKQRKQEQEWYLKALKCALNTLDPTSLMMVNLRINVCCSISQSSLAQTGVYNKHIQILQQMEYSYNRQSELLQKRIRDQQQEESRIQPQQNIEIDVQFSSTIKNKQAIAKMKEVKLIQISQNRMSLPNIRQSANQVRSRIQQQYL